LLSSTLADEGGHSAKNIKAQVDAVSTPSGEPPLLPPQVCNKNIPVACTLGSVLIACCKLYHPMLGMSRY